MKITAGKVPMVQIRSSCATRIYSRKELDWHSCRMASTLYKFKANTVKRSLVLMAGQRRGPARVSGRVGIPRAKGRAGSAAGAAGPCPGWEAINSLV